MRLLHGNEMHFVRCPDGRVYSTGIAVYSWWADYLEVFDEVRVVSRVKTVSEMYAPERLAEGSGVAFEDLPDYRGPEEFLRKSKTVHEIMKRAIDRADACLFRVPGTIGYLAARELIGQDRPYALEVVGDPYDVFVRGSVKHPLRAFFRQWHAHSLRRYCQAATATMYVTEHALQRRYPPSPNAFTTHYSDVEVKDDGYAAAPRALSQNKWPFRLIFVGTLEQLYKAPDVLIDAVHLCRQRDVDITLTFAGDGGCRPQLEAQVARWGLQDHVQFAGYISDKLRLRQMLDDADAFVLPSRAEGLPRAMIEAMARGIPCIGSSVDGIPELLSAEDLVPPGNAVALAESINSIANDPARRTRMSARNLATSRKFREDIMMARKVEFCRYLRECSASTGRKRVPVHAAAV